MMEYWNDGKMGSGKMEEYVIDRLPNDRKKDIIFLKNQSSITRSLHYSMVEARTKASGILYFSRRGIESPRHLDSLLLADIESGLFGDDLKYSQ